MSIGALSFSALERDHETELCVEAENQIQNFLQSLNPTHDENGTYKVTAEELVTLIRQVEKLAGEDEGVLISNV